jgi:tetratricopeptide (TPR) repeat protein
MAKSNNNNNNKSNEAANNRQRTVFNEATATIKRTKSDTYDSSVPLWLSFFGKKWIAALIIFITSSLVYTNTISHDYAVDDAIVITRNQFTRLGMKGMHGIWTEDTFVGFFGKQQNLVTGGRYRPLSVATFALEVALLGDHPQNPTTGEYIKDAAGDFQKDKDGNYLYDLKPNVSHFFNIVLYALLCVLIYFTILQLMSSKLIADESKINKDILNYGLNDEQGELKQSNGQLWAGFIAFAAAILYATHPVHTEAVANIKGRDEILVMLGSVMALHYAFKAAITDAGTKYIYWVLALLGFAIGIFSKESAIPFLAVIPAAIYIFAPKVSMGKSLLYAQPFFVMTLIFWFGIRAKVLEVQNPDDPMAKILAKLSQDMYKNHKTSFFWIKDEPTELMNNPFLKLENNQYKPYNDSERLGSILYTWGDYMRLLVMPHPLTNDYYPYHISVKKENIKGKVDSFRNYEPPSMSHGLPVLSLFVHLGLGFLGLWLTYRRNPFGFCILFYFATFSVVSNFFFPIGTNMAERFMFMPSFAFSFACGLGLAALARRPQMERIVLPLLLIVVALYSVKTYTRNFAWQNDYILFTTDIETSPNSAKLNNAVSGVLQDYLHTHPELTKEEREKILVRGLKHSTNAINMHPTYNNAWLLYGNANTMLASICLDKIGKTESVTIQINGQDMVFAPLEATLAYYDEAIRAYREVMRLRPDHPDAPINLGVAYRDKGKVLGEKMAKIPEALAMFKEATKLLPNDAETLRLLGIGYGMTQQHELAIEALERACQIYPNQAANWYNLGVAYNAAGNTAKWQECVARATQLDSSYTNQQTGGK